MLSDEVTPLPASAPEALAAGAKKKGCLPGRSKAPVEAEPRPKPAPGAAPALPEAELLRKALRSPDSLAVRDDPADAARYDARRRAGDGHTRTWNLSAVRWPAAIVTAGSVADVQAVLRHHAQHCDPGATPLAVASGRHSHMSMRTGALVLDMSRLRGVKVDTDKEKVTVLGGTVSKDLHDALAKVRDEGGGAWGVPTGNAYTVGLAGNWLHGGHGVLEKACGMAVDHLLEVEIVTADGEVRRCSATENAELFWATRGAASNFGVVTAMVARLRRVPDAGALMSGLSVQAPVGEGRRSALLTRYRDFYGASNDREATRGVFGHMVLPVGGPVVEAGVFLDFGPRDEGGAALAAHESAARASWAEHTKTDKYRLAGKLAKEDYFTEIQQVPEPVVPSAAAFYTAELSELSDRVIAILAGAAHGRNKAGSGSQIILSTGGVGGKRAHPGQEAGAEAPEMAYQHCGAAYHVIVIGCWKLQKEDAHRPEAKRWAEGVMAALSEGPEFKSTYNVTEGAEAGGQKLAERLFGSANLARLKELKAKHDPKNTFRLTTSLASEEEPEPTSPTLSV